MINLIPSPNRERLLFANGLDKHDDSNHKNKNVNGSDSNQWVDIAHQWWTANLLLYYTSSSVSFEKSCDLRSLIMFIHAFWTNNLPWTQILFQQEERTKGKYKFHIYIPKENILND